jgi:hypothetical protein
MGRWSWLFLVAACRFPDLVGRDGGGEDGPGTDTMPADMAIDGPYTAVTIQQVQDGAMPVGTPVMLTDVIVTAVDRYGDKVGDVYLQQPGGGAFSGITVFGATEDQLLGLDFRDIVTVTGVKTEFALAADTTGRTVTEIVASKEHPITIVHSGNNGTVAIEYLDATAIAAMPQAEQDQELAKWDGAYVQLSLVRAASNIGMVGVDPTYTQFSVPPFRVQSAIAPFPGGITTGTCFTSIRGVCGYFFNYNILPAQSGATIGAGCP